MATGWFLEGVAADGSHVEHEIAHLPFTIGRDVGNHLVVTALGLSRRHAELALGDGDALRLTDLGSTNGTFVNRERLRAPRLVTENDVIHFGNAEFRLGRAGAERTQAPADDRTVIAPIGQTLSEHFVPHERALRELLAGIGLAVAAQPIVRADAAPGELPFALELLGRSVHPQLPAAPGQLFHLAALLGRDAELSRAFREHGLRALGQRRRGATVFVNTHAKETFDPGLLPSLERLRAEGVVLDIVLEVHETAVVEVTRMRALADALRALGVRFAYDDFGAGQARLLELGDVPAHFVKFDMGLVRGIDRAGPARQKVVSDLVRLVRELGSTPLAEGVETEAEAAVCRQMGFELIQGYLTGKPVAVESL
jgi:EAL domain-containing protein (putative c-di-GMP-specific phosphodiesterase class I)